MVEWGSDALLKFNGMFALSFWDRKRKQLLLARDRYGIKPLYYFQNEQKLVFGSEQKAILEQPAFDRKINKQALLEYFTFQNLFTNQTLLEGILRLAPSVCHLERIGLVDHRRTLRKHGAIEGDGTDRCTVPQFDGADVCHARSLESAPFLGAAVRDALLELTGDPFHLLVCGRGRSLRADAREPW